MTETGDLSQKRGSKKKDKETKTVAESIDMSYKDYYKDYNDGVDEQTLDRYRYVLQKRNHERELEYQAQQNMYTGRGRSIKFRTPYNDFQGSSIDSEEAPKGRQKE